MSDKLLHLTTSGWADDVEKSELPVLVDFWAAWCPPCRAIAPTIEALAEEYHGRVRIGKVNVDEEPELAERFGIVSIPTLLLFRDGKVAEQRVGALPKPALAALLDSHSAATA